MAVGRRAARLPARAVGPDVRDVPIFKADGSADPAVPQVPQDGFATPSGKVELSSSILADLGFDPLPYHRPAPEPSAEYPYLVFSGVREDPFFQTGQRNIGVLRRRSPAPHFFVHPVDAARDGLEDGAWARLETEYGHVYAKISLQDAMRPGHVRVPHGWWYPETRGSVDLAGAFVSSADRATIRPARSSRGCLACSSDC